MKFLKYSILVFFVSVFVFSCKDRDDELQPASSLEIKDFIWKAMNIFYLYKSDVPDLADSRFTTVGELNSFLESFDSPESLYDGIQAPQDRFSFITSNYIELEKLFSGVSVSNGLEFNLKKYPDGSGNVYGFIRQILPDTDASNSSLKRGDIFNTIDGQQITEENFSALIGRNSYTIGLADFDGTTVTPNGVTVSLTKREYSENPIFIDKVIDVSNKKVGYLMYSGFIGDFDNQLNTVFGNFKAEGITDLVLDLRYNGGGSVSSAIDLSSMITGQFTGEIFSTEEWNDRLQNEFQQNNPVRLTNVFRDKIRGDGASINSLNLTKVYILTTGRSASASELVINSLDPYIDVVHIGDTTSGKYQASITLYDSDNFGRSGANRNHFYAIQPLVLKSLNKVGFTDYDNGLTPDIMLEEDLTNAGVLGDPEEPLLKAALDMISSGQRPIGRKSAFRNTKAVGNSRMFFSNYERMYIRLDQ